MLSAFNYAKGVVQGVEFSAKYHSGNFQAYGNLAVGQEKATDVVSNEYLFDNTTPLADLGGLTLRQYVDSHWIYTDHTQIVTGSAGAAYQFCGRASTPGEQWWDSWCGTKLSTDMIYGSGLRTGDANIGTEPPYAQFNASISHEFAQPDGLPVTVRFDVVNLFDTIYQIQKRHRHWRVRAAIRTAPRLLHRHFEEDMRSVMSLRIKGVAAVVGVLAVTELAWGADLAPPPAPAYYNWTGLYIGLNAGYASATVSESLSGATGSGSATMPGGIGGAQIGYNYQIGAVVVGFEADFDGSMATKSITAGIASGTNQIPWIGTLRGRVGYAFDRFLVYATAGGAATQLLSTVNVGGIGSASTSNTTGAWTAGGGLEVAITDNLSARVEYLYLDTGNIPVAQVGATPPPPFVTVTGHLQDNLVRAGFNYRLPVAW